MRSAVEAMNPGSRVACVPPSPEIVAERVLSPHPPPCRPSAASSSCAGRRPPPKVSADCARHNRPAPVRRAFHKRRSSRPSGCPGSPPSERGRRRRSASLKGLSSETRSGAAGASLRRRETSLQPPGPAPTHSAPSRSCGEDETFRPREVIALAGARARSVVQIGNFRQISGDDSGDVLSPNVSRRSQRPPEYAQRLRFL